MVQATLNRMTESVLGHRSWGLLLILLLPAAAAVWHENTAPTVEVVPAVGPAVTHLLWLTDDIPAAKRQLKPWSDAGFHTHIVSTQLPIRDGGDALDDAVASVSALVEEDLAVGPLYVVAEGPYGAVAVKLAETAWDRLVGIALQDLEDIEGHVASTGIDSNFDPNWLLPVGHRTQQQATDRLAVHIFPLALRFPQSTGAELEPHRAVSVAGAPMMEVSVQSGPRLELNLPHDVRHGDGPGLTETMTTTSMYPQITQVCATAAAPRECTEWLMVVPLGWRPADAPELW